MILFFEAYSIIQTLLLFRDIRKADVIYFHMRPHPPLSHNPRIKMIVERLIRFLNRKARVDTLPPEMINDHCWAMNKRAIDVVEDMTTDIENSAVYQTILRIIKDENILRCYKAQLVDDVSASLLFFRVAKDLVTDSNGICYLVPADNDNSKIQKESLGEEPLGEETLDRCFLPGSLRANQIRSFFRKIYALVTLLLLPTAYTILRFRRITLKKIIKKNYDIAMPVHWGFHKGDVVIRGVKRTHDDGYLYNDKIKRGRVVHIFNYWRFSPEIETNFKKVMDERGIPYVDVTSYRMSGKLVLAGIKLQSQIIQGFLSNSFYRHDRHAYIWYSSTIVYWMLGEYLQFENVDYKVEFVRNDYNPGHIVRTILCHQQGKKTVGIQHTATPYESPFLSYVHFDKYIVYGDIFVKAYLPYWEKLNLEKTGRESVDIAVNLLNNRSEMAELKDKLQKLYPARKYTAVIAMSSDVDYNPRSQWDEMYNALYRLKTHDETDFNLFLRFRLMQYTSSSENMIRFAKLPQHDERIIIDHTNFSTHELMALCDVFIACNISFSINEAVASGAKVFTFNLHGRAKHFFGDDYGSDFILDTSEDLLRVFRGLENDFKDFDCRWELLKKDCNHHSDGKNVERIQDAVWKLVES